MEKVFKYAMIAVLILLIVAGIIFTVGFINFMKPGVHSFLGYTRMDIQQKVFFIDPNSKQVSGSSTLTISGILELEDANGASGIFRGIVDVAEYPLVPEQGYCGFSGAASDGMISLANIVPNQEGVAYWLQMSSKDPGLYTVHIRLEDGSSITAYPGETQQEALENCEAYLQWYAAEGIN